MPIQSTYGSQGPVFSTGTTQLRHPLKQPESQPNPVTTTPPDTAGVLPTGNYGRAQLRFSGQKTANMLQAVGQLTYENSEGKPVMGQQALAVLVESQDRAENKVTETDSSQSAFIPVLEKQLDISTETAQTILADMSEAGILESPRRSAPGQIKFTFLAKKYIVPQIRRSQYQKRMVQLNDYLKSQSYKAEETGQSYPLGEILATLAHSREPVEATLMPPFNSSMAQGIVQSLTKKNLLSVNNKNQLELTPLGQEAAKYYAGTHGKDVNFTGKFRKTSTSDKAARGYDERLEDLRQQNKLDADIEARIQEKLSIANSKGSSGEKQKAEQWLGAVFRALELEPRQQNADVNKAAKAFEENLYGLEPLKQQFLQEVAVRARGGNPKGQILILVGPPGVGKTASSETLAKMMGRDFARISLAGKDDPRKLTGFQYTWQGSSYGEIIDAFLKAGSSNPLIQIDEFDKTGKSTNGDPVDVLHAVLDPSQNHEFVDDYLGVPVDLSQATFILTANTLDKIPASILDRAEIIEMDSYLPEDKVEIARQFMIPGLMKDFNFSDQELEIPRDSVEHIVDNYTKEAGVRKLKQKVTELLRGLSAEMLKNPGQKIVVTPALVDQHLSDPLHYTQVDPANYRVGEINGLYYSVMGGGILMAQAMVLDNGRNDVQITGQLGDVMRESVAVAQGALKRAFQQPELSASLSKEQQERVDKFIRNEMSLQVHYPAGAQPKDGPSAGITTATALWSDITQTPVSAGVGMTGEIDLHGNIRAIGGLKEKISGAVREGVTTFYVPEENARDLEAICKDNPGFVTMLNNENVEIMFVSRLEQLLGDLAKRAQAAPSASGGKVSQPRNFDPQSLQIS